jgi:hypothetical protein
MITLAPNLINDPRVQDPSCDGVVVVEDVLGPIL